MTLPPINIAPRKHINWRSPAILRRVRSWPKSVCQEIGRQLNKLEYGGWPDNVKSMQSIGPGVNEIRHSDDGDQYRLIYVAKFEEAIYVLHVITKKKTQQTSKLDIDLAKRRYDSLIAERKRLGL